MSTISIEKIIGYNNLFTAEMIIKSEPQIKIGSFHARFVCHISSEKNIIPNIFFYVWMHLIVLIFTSKLLQILYKHPLKYYSNRQNSYIDESCWVQNRTQQDSNKNLYEITQFSFVVLDFQKTFSENCSWQSILDSMTQPDSGGLDGQKKKVELRIAPASSIS